MTIADIIARLEKATGPDRELDRLIEERLERGIFTPIPPDADEGTVLEIIHHRPGHGWPKYTASIDAALTLVPEGVGIDLHVGLRNRTASAAVHGPVKSIDEKGRRVTSWRTYEAKPIVKDRDGIPCVVPWRTAAIALCIAALKAREAMK